MRPTFTSACTNCTVSVRQAPRQGTSGLLLFALDREVGRALSGQFERGEVAKTYLAVVRGYPLENGEIDYPLAHMADEHASMLAGWPAQPALTR